MLIINVNYKLLKLIIHNIMLNINVNYNFINVNYNLLVLIIIY
jgi:hypothetical protein